MKFIRSLPLKFEKVPEIYRFKGGRGLTGKIINDKSNFNYDLLRIENK